MSPLKGLPLAVTDERACYSGAKEAFITANRLAIAAQLCPFIGGETKKTIYYLDIMRTVFFENNFKSGLVLGLGFFDAVHSGHRALLRAVTEYAKKLSAASGEKIHAAAFTFSNNMTDCRKSGEKLIYTYPERLKIMQEIGIDTVVYAEMTPEFAATDGIAFLDALTSRYAIHAVFAGEDYRFGAGGRCGADTLKNYFFQTGTEVKIIDFVMRTDVISDKNTSATGKNCDADIRMTVKISDKNTNATDKNSDENVGAVAKISAKYAGAAAKISGKNAGGGAAVKISSSEIRTLLANGNIAEANVLLGAPYFICGEVVHCKGRGGSLGFPTANIIPAADKLKLKEGVYATVTEVDGKPYVSVTSAGTRPTFSEYEYVAETFIDGFSGDLYGKQITVRFLARLRDVRRFPEKEALREQIFRDIAAAHAAYGMRMDI
ncbi:MAG: hypothetical protein LBT55_02820 [Clostridiaceae bacterium]|jgi:FAD synthase|nr:hypothetical protein [Clostridiaceae bacterium]